VGNHVHHVDRQGLYADSWDKQTYDIRFFNNVVHDCGFGFIMSGEMGGQLNDVWFCNNVVYNNRGPGMGVMKWGEDGQGELNVTPANRPITKKNLYFINNTIVNNGREAVARGAAGCALKATRWTILW
jgi:polygalacturonase